MKSSKTNKVGIDDLVKFINENSKTTICVEKKEESDFYYICSSGKELSFKCYGKYAAWCFLAGYAIALCDENIYKSRVSDYIKGGDLSGNN